jgi:hypothetical protein
VNDVGPAYCVGLTVFAVTFFAPGPPPPNRPVRCNPAQSRSTPCLTLLGQSPRGRLRVAVNLGPEITTAVSGRDSATVS